MADFVKRILFIAACYMMFSSAAFAENYILSGNEFNNYDFQTYQDMSRPLKKLDTDAEYSWSEDSDAELVETDLDYAGHNITNGNLKNHSGFYVANCSWGGDPGTATVTFDLKKIYAIDYVDVWSESSNKGYQLGTIKIETSSDGINFSAATVYDAVRPDPDYVLSKTEERTMECTSCGIGGINAQYVRITFEKAKTTVFDTNCYQYALGECVIIGGQQRFPQASKPVFRDENNNTLFSWRDAGAINVSSDVQDSDSVLVTAQYGAEGSLKGVFLQPGQCEIYGTKYKTEQKLGNVSADDGDYFKAFVLKSLEGLMPLGEYALLEDADISRPGLLSSDKAVGKNTPIYCVRSEYGWVNNGEISTDAEFINSGDALFDGNSASTVSGTGNTECVRIDFTDIMQVTSVNVYAMCSASSFMSEYSIYASNDGINYDFIGTKNNVLVASLNRIMPVSFSVDGVLYAKHIKLVMKKAETAQNLQISEIEIMGRPPQFDKEMAVNYCYEQENPFKTAENIISADTSAVLSDGNKTEYIETAGDYVSIIYNLGGYYRVEDIAVFGEFAGMETLFSIDGYEYFTNGFYEEDNGSAVAMGPVYKNARFVKIVLRRGGAASIKVSEIEVNTRKVYDTEAEKNAAPDAIAVKYDLKSNNILYLDWSDYNGKQNSVTSYNVYIEKNNFTSVSGKSAKKVYCGRDTNAVYNVETQSCKYAGLEPDTDYYIAVTPHLSSARVSAVKIHTYSALGGDKLSGIFCINEYPVGGGAHVAHEDESANLQNKLKLLNDLEVISKTRYWTYNDSYFNMWTANGISAHTSPGNTVLSNSHGMYTFQGDNEPDLDKNLTAADYAERIKTRYASLKAVNAKNLISEPAICGTDKISFFEDMYKADENLGKYYDICDVHAYCKTFEGKNNIDDKLSENAEAYSIPEHLFAKKQKIDAVLSKYGDSDKDMIFSEIGWTTHNDDKNAHIAEKVTKEQQANFTARCYLISASLGIKNVFLYAFQDEGYEDTNSEYQFGIVDWYCNPKPAYYTYYTLGKLLKNAHFVSRMNELENPDYGMVFYDEQKDMYLTALWNISGDGKNISVKSSDGDMKKVDAYGNCETVRSESEITIGSAPVYIYSHTPVEVNTL